VLRMEVREGVWMISLVAVVSVWCVSDVRLEV
jgi:hypothetical protein